MKHMEMCLLSTRMVLLDLFVTLIGMMMQLLWSAGSWALIMDMHMIIITMDPLMSTMINFFFSSTTDFSE